MYTLLDLEGEQEKLKKLRDKRKKLLTGSGLGYLTFAIISSFFFEPIPVATQVLLPMSVGIAVGLVMSLISIKLSYNTSVKLLELQYALDEIRKQNGDVKQ